METNYFKILVELKAYVLRPPELKKLKKQCLSVYNVQCRGK